MTAKKNSRMGGTLNASVLFKPVKRRDFLKAIALGVVGWGVAPNALARNLNFPSSTPAETTDDSIKDYINKMKYFNRYHKNDILVSREEYRIFESTLQRLKRLQWYMGHGYFQKLSFNGGIYIARKYSEVGQFSRAELEFLEKIFYEDAANYGFYGQKPTKNLTERINKKDLVRDRSNGSYLYNGVPLETFKKIKRILGDNVVLTSGVRGIMKQFLLFLNKAHKYNGNLSLASRSLAPPGYSFHGIGDFDVGQAGFGSANFTVRFTRSGVYKKLCELGYLKLRYPRENRLGVRFEPWHIKTIT